MPARLYLVFKSPETVYYERVNQPFRFSVHVNLARCILELPTLGFLTNLRGSELFFLKNVSSTISCIKWLGCNGDSQLLCAS